MLYYHTNFKHDVSGKPSLVLCVPERYLPTVFHQYHDSILAGHPGIVKMYETLKQKYYFPGMINLIHQHVKSLEATRLLQNFRTLLKYVSNIAINDLLEREMTDDKHIWHILTAQLNKLAVDNREESLTRLEEKQISEQSLEYHNKQIGWCNEGT